jgi:microcystin-dependent protein
MVPDMRGRVAAGKDDMGGSAASRLTNPATTTGGVDGDTLGATGGEEAHQITVPELAAHTHTQDYTYGVYANLYDRTGGHVGERDSGSTGGDVAHNTVQPTLIANYIIKT